MAYEPRGKVAQLVNAMRAEPDRIWTSAEVAGAMDVVQGALSAHLDTAIRHGTLHRKLENGRCHYALKPFEPASAPAAPPVADEQEEQAEEAAPFHFQIHSDGDVDLHGLIELEDGGHRMTAEMVLKLKRFISWMPAP